MKFSSIRPLMPVLVLVASIFITGCSKASSGNSNGRDTIYTPPVTGTDVIFYKTTGSKSSLFARQPASLLFGTAANQFPTIVIDTAQTFQSMDGFGYTLTGGSAQLINTLAAGVRDSLLK